MIPENGIVSIEIVKAAKYIAMGLCMSIGGIGSALGQGFIGGKACEAAGKKPESAKALMPVMVFSLAFVETTTVLCFVVALIMFFVG